MRYNIAFIFFVSHFFMSLGQEVVTTKKEGKYPTFKFTGILKNKFEYAPEHGTARFDVRNSRLCLAGKIYPKVDYVAKLELSDEGKFKVLDLFGEIKPIDNLKIRFGQFGLPIFNSYITNPGKMPFANRAFVGKYFTGSRDIGIMGVYDVENNIIPLRLELGFFNGDSSNNPVWSNKVSYAGRVILGKMIGLRSSIKFFDKYQVQEEDEFKHLLLYGADVRYGKENWKVEAEFMNRKDYNEDVNRYSAYLQGAYAYRLNKDNIITSLVPAVRFDFIDEDNNNKNFDVTRFTAGIGFGLGEKLFRSIIRVDYERYNVNQPLEIFAETKEKDADKLTVELVYMF